MVVQFLVAVGIADIHHVVVFAVERSEADAADAVPALLGFGLAFAPALGSGVIDYCCLRCFFFSFRRALSFGVEGGANWAFH
jgi:hypothetical protein